MKIFCSSKKAKFIVGTQTPVQCVPHVLRVKETNYVKQNTYCYVYILHIPIEPVTDVIVVTL